MSIECRDMPEGWAVEVDRPTPSDGWAVMLYKPGKGSVGCGSSNRPSALAGAIFQAYRVELVERDFDLADARKRIAELEAENERLQTEKAK